MGIVIKGKIIKIALVNATGFMGAGKIAETELLEKVSLDVKNTKELAGNCILK